MHVDYVSADTIQEVLGVGYQHKDPLEPVAPHKLLETKLGKEFLLVGPDDDKGFTCTRSLLPIIRLRKTTALEMLWEIWSKAATISCSKQILQTPFIVLKHSSP